MTTPGPAPLVTLAARPKDTYPAYEVTEDNLDAVVTALQARDVEAWIDTASPESVFLPPRFIRLRRGDHRDIAKPGNIIVDRSSDFDAPQVYRDRAQFEADFDVVSAGSAF